MVGRASLSSFSLSLSSAAQRPPSHHGQNPSSSQSQAQIQAQRTTSGRTETGAWPCTLDGCNKVFAREADLKRHQRTTKSHSIPGSNVANPCPLCEATFTRSDAMRRHLKSRHQGRTPETLNLQDTPSGPSTSNMTSGASSSRGANRRAYSPSEETSELSASDSEQQSYHHHQQHQQTTTTQSQQSYASSSRNPSTSPSSASYYSSPPISPVQTASSPTSTHHGMHHQNASNLSSQVLYQAAMSYEIQHALSSPRHSSATVSSPSSSSSRRDTTTTTSASYPMHPQQAVSMPMSSQQPHSSYSPYTSPVSEQYPVYQQYPAYTSSNGYPVTGGSGSGGGGSSSGGGSGGNGGSMYANPYMGTANRAGGGYMMNNGVSWGGKIEEGVMDDGRGGIPPPRQSGGLATLAMHASRIRPMSPLSPAKTKSSKSELENALGPAGVYRR